MAYKLMAVDIDGTLVNSKGILTEKTKQAIKLATESGLIFSISTGRPIQGVEFLNKELQLNVPFITYNGAMVVMGETKEVLYEQKMTQKSAKAVIDLGKKYKTTILVWADNKLFITEDNEKTDKYKSISSVEPLLVDSFDEIIKNGVTKILWYDDIDTINHYQDTVGQYLDETINLHTSRPYFLEFVDRNASKAIAMEKIGEQFGIKQSEMIAVGDGYNDVSMIEYAGLGVAMANAPQDIKDLADYVTLSNDEDGVADVIYKFVLKG